jgi:hypothetical protein
MTVAKFANYILQLGKSLWHCYQWHESKYYFAIHPFKPAKYPTHKTDIPKLSRCKGGQEPKQKGRSLCSKHRHLIHLCSHFDKWLGHSLVSFVGGFKSPWLLYISGRQLITGLDLRAMKLSGPILVLWRWSCDMHVVTKPRAFPSDVLGNARYQT